jgi:hypothetical protein
LQSKPDIAADVVDQCTLLMHQLEILVPTESLLAEFQSPPVLHLHKK